MWWFSSCGQNLWFVAGNSLSCHSKLIVTHSCWIYYQMPILDSTRDWPLLWDYYRVRWRAFLVRQELLCLLGDRQAVWWASGNLSRWISLFTPTPSVRRKNILIYFKVSKIVPGLTLQIAPQYTGEIFRGSLLKSICPRTLSVSLNLHTLEVFRRSKDHLSSRDRWHSSISSTC